MKTKHYYRDVLYLWLFLFLLPMLGVIVCAILLLIGGENSHISLYMQGYVNGNSANTIKFEDITSIMFVLGGMSLAFNLLLFTNDRRILINHSPLTQFGLFLICLIVAFCAYYYDLNHTALEIQDEVFNYNKIIGVCDAFAAFITFTLASLVYWRFWLLPVAKNVDKVNLEKLLNFKNS